ncbi:MAG: hypothetical protein QME76_02075 [Bacillota bacterium]|nr:hypothetical protein [Bacillota bacterium]
MKHVVFPEGRLVELRIRRALLVLSEQELIDLLRRDPGLWQQALLRGKALKRARLAQERAKGDAPSRRYARPEPAPAQANLTT